MSIKKNKFYHSFLMLVRVNSGNGFNISIPISLFVLDQTFDALEDLLWLVEKLFINWVIRARLFDNHPEHKRFLSRMDFKGAPSRILGLCREVIDELRSYGRWRMVEVEVPRTRLNNLKSRGYARHGGEVRVYIDFI